MPPPRVGGSGIGCGLGFHEGASGANSNGECGGVEAASVGAKGCKEDEVEEREEEGDDGERDEDDRKLAALAAGVLRVQALLDTLVRMRLAVSGHRRKGQ